MSRTTLLRAMGATLVVAQILAQSVTLTQSGAAGPGSDPSASVMKEIRDEIKEIRREVRDLEKKRNEADRKSRLGKPDKSWKPSDAGSCNCAVVCDAQDVAGRLWGFKDSPAKTDWIAQLYNLDAAGRCAEIITRAGGASQVSNANLPPPCKTEIRGCPSVQQELFRVEMSNESENLQMVIEGKRADIKDLDARIKDERKEKAREYERCPECAMMKAMQPRDPGVGDYILGALQGITPVVGMGFGAWSTATAWTKFAGAYDTYWDQCRTIGVPCASPEQVLYGGGRGFMGGIPPGSGGWQQSGGTSFPGSNFGFFGPNGMTQGSSGLGIPGMPGLPGLPGMGQGFSGGFNNIYGYGIDNGWGIMTMPMGTGFNSPVYPFGPIGSFQNGQNQSMYGASMQSYMGVSQYAMGGQFSAIIAQQNLFEAQRRYYETMYSAWNSGLSGFQNQAGPFAPQFP